MDQSLAPSFNDNELDFSINDFFSNNHFNSEEESLDENKKTENLHDYTKVDIKTFNKLFMGTVESLLIPETRRDAVLDLIRLVLPTVNNLPTSYHMIQKTLPKPEMSSFMICKICGDEISSSKYNDSKEKLNFERRKRKLKKCTNENCSSNKMALKSKSFIKVYSLNIFTQLKNILTNHEPTIKKYMGIKCFILF